ncbi:nitrate ABC transporter permease [Microbacterium sp. Root61]|uniref:ABC transporter permease n=1 Tax=Microbacterium sp. Root61 TaxID=1736570 RepID=UPI0006F8E5FC|nr:ABC transporter permease [Microbacterium sp. Root61]KRA25441.1 nitrate ABC transporter permease [Microbacterium sp. Root61]
MKALRWIFVTFAVPVVLIALWTLFAEIANSLYWPSPVKIVGVFPQTWLDGQLSTDVLPSLTRLAIGYICAVVIALILGIVVGSFRRLRLYLEPVFELFRAIPPPLLVPIVMLFTGRGAGMQITVIAFGCLWPILINTVEGVRGIDMTQLDTAKSYRISGWRRLTTVVLPAASPKIFVGARQALSIGIIMMVISEMFVSTDGIGFNIIQFQRLFQFKEMWSGIILLGIVGVVANVIFKFIERRVLRWYVGMQTQER